jgi:hypothetical protein
MLVHLELGFEIHTIQHLSQLIHSEVSLIDFETKTLTFTPHSTCTVKAQRFWSNEGPVLATPGDE